jgi:hypothetical protein
MLDESQSFGMIGSHGRGISEYFDVPVCWMLLGGAITDALVQASEVDMLIGSMATGLAAGGGFCAGSAVVCSHQVNPIEILLGQWLIHGGLANQLLRICLLCRPPSYARHNIFRSTSDPCRSTRSPHRLAREHPRLPATTVQARAFPSARSRPLVIIILFTVRQSASSEITASP